MADSQTEAQPLLNQLPHRRRRRLLAAATLLSAAAVGFAATSSVTAFSPLSSAFSAQSTKSFGVNFATGLMANPPTTSAEMSNFVDKASYYKIPRLKLWGYDATTLDTIQSVYGSNLPRVMVHVPNKEVQSCADDPLYATNFVKAMNQYSSLVTSVAVGNELDNGDETLWAKLPQACKKMRDAVAAAGVTTAAGSKLQVTSPMSNAVTDYNNGDVIFKSNKVGVVSEVVQHIDFFSINLYPVFNYADQDNTPWHEWVDGKSSSFDPDSMLESQVKNTRHALEASSCSGCSGKELAITETGWATEGGSSASFALSDRFFTHAVEGIEKGGWDGKYGVLLDQVYLFELFDESKKGGGTGMEPHYGLLQENGSPKNNGAGFAVLGS